MPAKLGRPPTFREQVVTLYGKGIRPSDIARRLNRHKQQVSSALKDAGITPLADVLAQSAKLRERVRAQWQRTPGITAVAHHLGLKVAQVRHALAKLRRQGVKLRPLGPRPTPKRDAIEARLLAGESVEMVIGRGIADYYYVRLVWRRMKDRGQLRAE